MRVLMVNDYGSVGGAALYVKNLSAELTKMGHHVLFASCDDYDGKDSFNTHEFKAVKGGAVSKAFARLNNADATRLIKRLVRETNPDVIHVHCFFDEVTSRALIDSLPKNVPVVVTLHDDNFVKPDPRKKGFLKYIYGVQRHASIMKFFRRVNAFISPSSYIADQAINLGFSPRVITNGVPIKPVYTKPTTHDLLFVGRVDVDKGVMYLVEAMKILVADYPLLKLTVVGDGSVLSLLKGYVKAFDLQKNVLFAGQVKSEQLAPYYKACGIVVVPSICQDNQPTTILEAACYGRAVVASHVGGIPELLLDGNGITIPAANPVILSKAISNIIEDNAYVYMGVNAFRNAKRYSMKDNASKVLEVYKEVIE